MADKQNAHDMVHAMHGTATSYTFVNRFYRAIPFGLLVLLLAFAHTLEVCAGPLEEYVYAPDSSFNWKKTETKQINKATVTHLELVSQTWRGQFWSHHIQVVRPETVRNPDIAFLFITGDGEGDNNIEMLNVLAQRAGAVAAVITKIPNQPLYDGRHEDSLIAFTFANYLKTKDTSWLLLFPMVKSAVRGMDAIEQFTKQESQQDIKRFVVSGASKRGWTTWLTAATDKRVAAFAPMVIDMLNMQAQLKWAEKMYGRQSEEIKDYTDLNLHLSMDDPDHVRLRELVDPYSYRSKYTMPKLILIGTNDPYWVVDSLRHYWNDLPGHKLIFQTPNAGHNLGGGKEATQTLAAWFQMIADKQKLPEMEWKFEDGEAGGSLSVSVDQTAKAVTLWTAESPDRDFRNEKWSSQPVQFSSGSSHATTKVEKPGQGYRAYLGEVTLTSPTGHDYKLSTEARVTPDGVRK